MAILGAFLIPEWAYAQPVRSMPGTRPYLPGSPPINQTPLNPRTRAAASAYGVESTDFYGKKGYPRVLGDAVETQTTGTSSGGSSAAGISGGSTGSLGGGISGGSTGSLSGGLSGTGSLAGGSFRNNPLSGPISSGITGGGFTGLVPKGFGFGGLPTTDDSSTFWFRK